MSGEFDSRKDSQSTKFERRPQISIKLSFRELCDSKLSGLHTSFNCRFFLNRFPACFNLFVLPFLVTPCLVVAVQPCMERIPIKKKKKKKKKIWP